MNKTFLNHLETSSFNLDNLSYKLYSTIKNLIKSVEVIDKDILISMLKTYKHAMTITLDDFEFMKNKMNPADSLYPYIDYLSTLVYSTFKTIDELIHIVEEAYSPEDDSFNESIKNTLFSIQDIISQIHDLLHKIRERNEKEQTDSSTEKE